VDRVDGFHVQLIERELVVCLDVQAKFFADQSTANQVSASWLKECRLNEIDELRALRFSLSIHYDRDQLVEESSIHLLQRSRGVWREIIDGTPIHIDQTFVVVNCVTSLRPQGMCHHS